MFFRSLFMTLHIMHQWSERLACVLTKHLAGILTGYTQFPVNNQNVCKATVNTLNLNRNINKTDQKHHHFVLNDIFM